MNRIDSYTRMIIHAAVYNMAIQPIAMYIATCGRSQINSLYVYTALYDFISLHAYINYYH